MGLETYLGKYTNDDNARKKFAVIMNRYAGGDNLKEIGSFFKKIKEYDEDLIPKILDDSKEYIDKNIFIDYTKAIEHVYEVDENLVESAIYAIGNYKSNFRETRAIINAIDEIKKPKELKIFLDIFSRINVEEISPINLEEYIEFFKLFPPSHLLMNLKQSGVYINK